MKKSLAILFSVLILANCDNIKRRADEILNCDNYDMSGLVPDNEELCYKLPLLQAPCGDGEMPYKCCYYEFTQDDGSKRKGCHEISKKSYDRLDDYIQEKKTENSKDDLVITCDPKTNKENAINVSTKYIIVSMLSLILLFL